MFVPPPLTFSTMKPVRAFRSAGRSRARADRSGRRRMGHDDGDGAARILLRQARCRKGEQAENKRARRTCLIERPPGSSRYIGRIFYGEPLPLRRKMLSGRLRPQDHRQQEIRHPAGGEVQAVLARKDRRAVVGSTCRNGPTPSSDRAHAAPHQCRRLRSLPRTAARSGSRAHHDGGRPISISSSTGIRRGGHSSSCVCHGRKGCVRCGSSLRCVHASRSDRPADRSSR